MKPQTFKSLALALLTLGLFACNNSGNGYSNPKTFYTGITVDSYTNPQNLYVLDAGLAAVDSISISSGVVTTIAGTPPRNGSVDNSISGLSAEFFLPMGITNYITGGNSTLYVADKYNDAVRVISSPTASAGVTTLAGNLAVPGHADGTGTAATFNLPQGVVTDTSGNVFVADTNNQTIRMITPGGVTTTIAGSYNTIGTADGASSTARFNYPFGITIDAAVPQNLYVSDVGNNSVRKLTPVTVGGITTWTVSTLAGSVAGTSGFVDAALGATARFNQPLGITSDGTNLYVADSNNNAIRMITPAGVVSTLAGSAAPNSVAGNLDGNGTAARLNNPFSLVYAHNNLYVVDQNNLALRIISTAGANAVTTIP